jgi:hypothetical protein
MVDTTTMKALFPITAATAAAAVLAAAPAAGAHAPQVACPVPPPTPRGPYAEAYAIGELQQNSTITVSCTELTAAQLPLLTAARDAAVNASHLVPVSIGANTRARARAQRASYDRVRRSKR